MAGLCGANGQPPGDAQVSQALDRMVDAVSAPLTVPDAVAAEPQLLARQRIEFLNIPIVFDDEMSLRSKRHLDIDGLRAVGTAARSRPGFDRLHGDQISSKPPLLNAGARPEAVTNQQDQNRMK